MYAVSIYCRKPRAWLPVALAALFGISAPLMAVSAAQAGPISTWIGPANGNWDAAANWSPAGVPGANASVVINNGNSPVIFNASATALDSLAIATGNQVNVLNGLTLTLNGGGTSAINGRVSLGATVSTTRLSVGGTGEATLSGSGELALGNNTGNSVSKVNGATASLRIAPEFTIRGSGSIGGFDLTVNNQGTIRADSSAGLSMLLGGTVAAPVTWTNTGKMEANGGTLAVKSSVTGATLDNTGGTLWASSGSTLALVGNSGNTLIVKGGDFRTADSGIVTASTATLSNGATIAQGIDFQVNDAQSATLAAGGIYTVNGRMSLYASVPGGNNTRLNLSGTGTVTLAGTGELVLSDNSKNQVVTGSGTALVNSEGFTIRGSGTFGTSGQMPNIDNRGTIRAEGSAGLLLGLSSGNTITNNGVLAARGGTLTISGGTVDNTATGTLQADGSTISVSGTTLKNAVFTTGSSSSGTVAVGTGTTVLSQGATIGTGINVAVADSRTLTLNGGSTYTDNGKISLSSTGSATILKAGGSGTVTLGGAGEIVMSNNAANQIAGGGASSLVNGANHTIHGAGLIGTSGLKIDNQGIIRADSTAGLTMQVGATGVPVTSTNTGRMEANGGTLTITGLASGSTLDNTGGTLWANGSTLAFTVAGSGTLVVKAGDFRTTGSGIVTAASGTTLGNGATIAQGIDFRVANAQTLQLNGGSTYTNNGKISLNSTGSVTILKMGGTGTTVTLAGTGEVAMGNNAANQINGPAALINGAGHTIHGSGTIGGASLQTVTNNGTIRADQTVALTVNLTGTLTNNGILQANAGSLMDIVGTLGNYNATTKTLTGGTYKAFGDIRFANADIVTNKADVLLDGTGTIKNRAATPVSAFRNFAVNDAAGQFALDHGASFNTLGNFSNAGVLTVGATAGAASLLQVNAGAGTLTQTGGSTTVDGTLKAALVNIMGGTFGGSGTVQGSATVGAGASVGPGNSPGKLSFTNNFTLANDADYDVQLAGIGTGEYDVIDVAGTATLANGADIDVALLDAYDPLVGSFFDVLVAGSLVANLSMLDFLFPTFTDGRFFTASIVDLPDGRDALRLTVGGTMSQGIPAPGGLPLFLLAAGAAILVRRRTRG